MEKNLYVNGTTQFNEDDCAKTAVGTGKRNTELLVKAMDTSAYRIFWSTDTTAVYAAKLCDDLIYNGFDDWFLPSKDELNLLFVNLTNFCPAWQEPVVITAICKVIA